MTGIGMKDRPFLNIGSLSKNNQVVITSKACVEPDAAVCVKFDPADHHRAGGKEDRGMSFRPLLAKLKEWHGRCFT
jgi:hypothetical protein